MTQRITPGAGFSLVASFMMTTTLMVVCSLASWCYASASPQQAPEVTELAEGQPVERELAGGQTHVYRVRLTDGQYMQAVVEQRGIDVVVVVMSAAGQKIYEGSRSESTHGAEDIHVLASASDSYQLAVRASEKEAVAGRYQVRIEVLRAATSPDRDRVAGQAALALGMQRQKEDTAESRSQAIIKYREALNHWQSARDKRGEADTLSKLTEVYYHTGELSQALNCALLELPLRRATDDRVGEATILNDIGVVYGSLGERQKALDYYHQALPLRRAVGDRSGEATTLSNIGVVYRSLGERQKALDYYHQALSLMRTVGDRKGEAITLNNIGAVYNTLGEPQQALDYYTQALPLTRAVGDRRAEANTLSNIGVVYGNLGEHQKALDYYHQALPLRRTVGDRSGEARTLINIGVDYQALGEPQQALDYYTQALPLTRAVGDRRGEAHNLKSLGFVYQALGEPQQALDYFNQALPLMRAVGDHSGEANTLTHIGNVYNTPGEPQQALDYYHQALSLMRTVGNRRGEANILNNIGAVYNTLGESQQALNYFNQALLLRRTIGDRGGEAITLNNIGAVYRSLGEPQQALDYYTQALPLARAAGDRRAEADVLLGFARLEQARGNFTTARTHMEQSLTIIESLRAKVVSHDLRNSFFASVQDFYHSYIQLLMQMHRQQPSARLDLAALEASERARARSLLELLAEAQVDLREGVEPQLLERERHFQQLLYAKSDRLITLLNQDSKRAQAPAAAKEIETLTAALQQVQSEIRQTSPRYAALTQPQPLQASQIQHLLDDQTLLLEYALGEPHSYLWLISPTGVRSFELPSRALIEQAARHTYELLTPRLRREAHETAAQRQARMARADADYASAATALSQMLLGAVADQLGTKRLVVVSDGALQYIPFAALPKPVAGPLSHAISEKTTNQRRRSSPLRPPLIAEHEIINLPSASTLALLRREMAGRALAPKMAAVLADPVFELTDLRVQRRPDNGAGGTLARQATTPAGEAPLEQRQLTRALADTGVLAAGQPIPRLPFSRDEARAIERLTPPSLRRLAVDFQVNYATATDPALGHYRIVHFATHSLLNSQHPELSGVLLSLVDEQGRAQPRGVLRLGEIYNLKLPVELVVLSACQTALGKEVKGEGLVGLVRGFMYAGAARVTSSLWKVDDEATAELMKLMYEGMLGKEGLRPAAALRRAQLEMWRREPWRAPYYWGAFTLQGEWK